MHLSVINNPLDDQIKSRANIFTLSIFCAKQWSVQVPEPVYQQFLQRQPLKKKPTVNIQSFYLPSGWPWCISGVYVRRTIMTHRCSTACQKQNLGNLFISSNKYKKLIFLCWTHHVENDKNSGCRITPQEDPQSDAEIRLVFLNKWLYMK